MKISDLPVDRPVATVMLLVALVVLGFVSLYRLPLGFMPTFDEPEVDVNVNWPGSHAVECMREVMQPIEAELSGIDGVKRVSGWVWNGGAWIEARFDWSANMDLKQLEVREAVERVRPSLPSEIGHISVEGDVGGSGGEILEGRISAERDLSESWELLDRRIRRPLERIRGVSKVDLYGVEPKQVRIDLDLAALTAHDVDAGEVLRALNAGNADVDVGAVRGSTQRWDVRSTGRFDDLGEIRNLSIGAGSLRLRDVATVELREPRLSYGRHLDRKFAVGITVHKEPTANTVDTVDRLLERIEDFDDDPQLRGVTLLVWENAGEEIRNSVQGLRDAGVFGGMLAIGVLFVFLRKLRTTLVVAVAIPFSLLVTCGAMYALGAEFNVLTLLGLMLGVGMLVDNAVVVMENIHRRQQQGLAARDSARFGTREVFLAVVASTATTIIVWAWLFVFDRDEMTIMMGQVALTICLSVACSLLVSVTFIPLASARLPVKEESEPGFVLGRIVPAYRRLLGWALRHRLAALALLFALALSAGLPFSKIEKTDQPRVVIREVALTYDVYDASTKEVLEGYVYKVEAWLEERKDRFEYESVYSWYDENGSTMTRIFLAREKATDERLEALRKALREELPSIPGVVFDVRDREWWRNRDQGRRMVQVAFRGEDPDFVRRLTWEAEGRLLLIPEAIDVRGPTSVGQREVQVHVDPERTRALGLSPRRIAEAVSFSFRGQHLRSFQTKEGEVQMLIGLPDDAQPGVSGLGQLRLPREDRDSVMLASVAEMERSRTTPGIWRQNRTISQWVGIEFDPDAVTTEQAQEKVKSALASMYVPPGYRWDFGDWGWQRDEGLKTMQRGLGLSLMVVVLLMAALFESFRRAFAVIITLPLAFVGAFWSLWLAGHQLDVIAFMGLIVLVGIVVNNGIVMVDHVNQLRREGMERRDALLEGCGNRLRPVLMTAATTLFGLLPLALADPTVAGVYIDSLPVAVTGGLATSTIFTLVALPVWYSAIEDFGKWLLRFVPRRAAAVDASAGAPPLDGPMGAPSPASPDA